MIDPMKKFEIEQAIKHTGDCEELTVKIYSTMARDYKLFFDCIKEHGFTSEQAIKLVCQKMVIDYSK